MDRARQLFQEGVWADPRSPSTVFLFHAWGSLEWREGNAGTARELFKAAIRVRGVGAGAKVLGKAPVWAAGCQGPCCY